ncbi:hypothetical protein WS68_15930 [Burkholderia sp. TSV86]|nr:hypothetical protein WS68_15930 [Burkholderia sp. TSV86]
MAKIATAAAKPAVDTVSGKSRKAAGIMPNALDTPDTPDGGAAAHASTCLMLELERGQRILSEFSALELVLSAPELSKRIGISRTTTFHLSQALVIHVRAIA